MSSLASATLESYNRSYPFLMQLHILREVENGYAFVHLPSSELQLESSNSHQSDSLNHHWLSEPSLALERSDVETLHSTRNKLMAKWDWEGRYQMLSPSSAHRSFLLAIRRSLLDMCEMKQSVANNWLTLRSHHFVDLFPSPLLFSSMMQHASRSDLAHLALNNALRYDLDTDRATIQVSSLS
jgi:hypothetical protein